MERLKLTEKLKFRIGTNKFRKHLKNTLKQIKEKKDKKKEQKLKQEIIKAILTMREDLEIKDEIINEQGEKQLIPITQQILEQKQLTELTNFFEEILKVATKK